MTTGKQRINHLAASALCICGLAAAAPACVQGSASGAAPTYPARPVRLIIPFAPGGGSDVLARMLGPRLAERLGQPVVVDNRPAAAGVVGADIVAKAAPDGYTLLGTTPTFVISGVLRTNLPYDSVRDFTPITLAILSPFGLLLHPSVPAKTVKEFIAYAKATPGKLLYGSSGAGGSPHLATELFNSMAGLKMTHVPYKGIAPAITAQLGNEVQVTFSNVFSTMGHWKAGRLRLVAHGGSRRAEAFPEIPTITESGVPGFEASNWYGYVAPAKTPRPIIEKLAREITAVVLSSEVKQTLISQGNDVVANTPDEFAKVIKADAERWGTIGRKLGVRLD
jgi:tripartite-type tricarboxylate transporter receptor subunit TctC